MSKVNFWMFGFIETKNFSFNRNERKKLSIINISPYVCFIFKSDLLNPNLVEKNLYFILVFLEKYFFDEQSKFLDVWFY